MVIDALVEKTASSEHQPETRYHAKDAVAETKHEEPSETNGSNNNAQKQNVQHDTSKAKNTNKRIVLQGDTIGKPREQRYDLQSITFTPPALVFSYDKGTVVRNFFNEMSIRNVQTKTNSIYSAPQSRKLLTLAEASKEDIGFLWT